MGSGCKSNEGTCIAIRNNKNTITKLKLRLEPKPHTKRAYERFMVCACSFCIENCNWLQFKMIDYLFKFSIFFSADLGLWMSDNNYDFQFFLHINPVKWVAHLLCIHLNFVSCQSYGTIAFLTTFSRTRIRMIFDLKTETIWKCVKRKIITNKNESAAVLVIENEPLEMSSGWMND